MLLGTKVCSNLHGTMIGVDGKSDIYIPLLIHHDEAFYTSLMQIRHINTSYRYIVLSNISNTASSGHFLFVCNTSA